MRKLLLAALLVLPFISANAQTKIYSTAFEDTASTAPYAPTLPKDWITSDSVNGWVTLNDPGNAGSGYTGASGKHMLTIKNAAPTGTYTITSGTINASQYTNLTATWAARNTSKFPLSGSTIKVFWSKDDGSTWDSLHYVEATNNSTWMLVNGGNPVQFPSAANNASKVKLKWVANIVNNSSGTYRIDDLNIMGTAKTGVTTELKPEPVFNSWTENNRLHLQFQNFDNTTAAQLNIFDVNGKAVRNQSIAINSQVIDVQGINSGIYIIRIATPQGVFTNKVIL
jgi:hypothetical protein